MQLNFNANEYDPTQGGAVCLPLADYKVQITAAQPMVVKDNPSAGYLEITLTVEEGELRGLIQKDRLNIFHTSDVAKRIAHQQLAAYCFAINRPYLQDTEQMLGGRCIATIGPQDSNPKYSEVKLIKCMDGSMPTRPPQAQGAQAGFAPPQAPPQPPAQPPFQAPPQAPPQMYPPQAIPSQVAPPAATAPPWNGAPAAPTQPAWAGQVPPPPNTQAAPGAVPPWAKQ